MAIGLVVTGVLTLTGISKGVTILVLTGALAGLCVLDVLRLRSSRANVLFFKAFRYLATPREATRVASSTWYALGLLVVVTLFPLHAAVSGILVLAAGDPAASYVGRRWGKRPFLGGTLEGTIVFVAASFCVLAPRHPPLVALAAALVAAVTERLSRPLDDNLTLPVVTAGVVTLLRTFT
jgi:dolichol kinase